VPTIARRDYQFRSQSLQLSKEIDNLLNAKHALASMIVDDETMETISSGHRRGPQVLKPYRFPVPSAVP
jgi:hypothetical protein